MDTAHQIPLDDADKLRASLRALAEESDLSAFVELIVTMLMKMSGDQKKLMLRLKKMLQSKYASKSEKLNAAQLELFHQALQAFEANQLAKNGDAESSDGQDSASSTESAPSEIHTEKNKTKKKGHGRKVLPAHLPREEHILKVPEDERHCKMCGSTKVGIGHVSSERLQYRPATLVVISEKREKMACKSCQGDVSVAPTAPHIIERGSAAEGLLAHVSVAKFVDGIPLTRQSKMMRREGVHLAESTLGDLVRQTAEPLIRLAEHIKQRVLAAPFINQDDTGLSVLDQDHPKGIKKGHIWGYAHGRDVFFEYSPDWRGVHPQTCLRDYEGIIQGDGYSGINPLFTAEANAPIRAGCMMHCRRYFHEAWKAGDPAASVALALIGDIYHIEAKAKKLGLSADARLALRQVESIPLMERLKRFIDATRPLAAPKTSLGKAITYATRQWAALLVPFDHGILEIDNGDIERRFKALAVARKNFLFAGSDKAAERSAVVLTVLSTAVSHGLDPFMFLQDVLEQIAAGLPRSRTSELHPIVWAQKRGQQLDAYQAPIPLLVQ